MNSKLLSLLASLTLSTVCASGASVATVATGLINTTVAQGTTSYLSLPLTAQPVYTGSVSAVTTSTISVGDSPAPFTMNLATPSAPYLVKFLSGQEMGRVLLITANTTSTLSFDLTDNSTASVDLLANTNFSVAAGDTFEILPGATLASMFGDNSAQNPLKLAGATSSFTADHVGTYSASLSRWKSFFFNTTANCWETTGSTVNANNTVLFPYAALTVTRQGQGDVSLPLTGRVAEVPVLVKSIGQSVATHVSTGYATDMTLAQISLGSNWVQGSNALTASTLSVWNAALNRSDVYYQLPDSTWRKTTDAVTDQSNFVISAATSMTVVEHNALSGGSSFLASKMPYSVN